MQIIKVLFGVDIHNEMESLTVGTRGQNKYIIYSITLISDFAPISPSSFEHPLKSVPNYQAASPKSISPYHSASPPSGHYTSSLGTSRIKPSVHDISSTLGTYSQSQISKSISPVEGTKDLSWPPQLATQERSGKLQKSQQVLVPGNHLSFRHFCMFQCGCKSFCGGHQ